MAKEDNSYEMLSFYKEGRGYWAIYPSFCKSCGTCKKNCPKHALKWTDIIGGYGTKIVNVDINACMLCRKCEKVCPEGAIKLTKERRGI